EIIKWDKILSHRIIQDSLFVYKDFILLGTENQEFHAFNSLNGQEVWQYRIQNPFLTGFVVLKNEIILTTSKGYIDALKVETGEKIWGYKIDTKFASSLIYNRN